MNRTLLVCFTMASFGVGGAALVACSTSSSSSNVGGSDGSADQTSGDSSAQDSSAQDSSSIDSAADTATGDAGCAMPSTLHPPRDAGATIYCPFSGADGGRAVSCTAQTQHCCEPAMGTAACQPIATACATGDTDWKCEDPVADCMGGQVCCAQGAMLVVSTDPSCGNRASQFTGSACVAAGACTGGLELCTSNSECSGGKTCVPFRAKGNQIGACN